MHCVRQQGGVLCAGVRTKSEIPAQVPRAAIGLRMHSGWGALVAVCHHAGAVEILERRRVMVVAPETQGGKQPYHFAASLELPMAEKFLMDCFAASEPLAAKAIDDVIRRLRHRGQAVIGAAVLQASGHPLPPLAKILASHALIHAAEGEFFREVVSRACRTLDLKVVRLREHDLDQCVQSAFPKASTQIKQQISTLGRSLGPPWTQDQKTAALAALVFLEGQQNAIAAGWHAKEGQLG
jgi:hypothetical protein